MGSTVYFLSVSMNFSFHIPDHVTSWLCEPGRRRLLLTLGNELLWKSFGSDLIAYSNVKISQYLKLKWGILTRKMLLLNF